MRLETLLRQVEASSKLRRAIHLPCKGANVCTEGDYALPVNAFAPYSYPGGVRAKSLAPDFPRHLAALRKEHSLTQQALAERVGVHVVQLRRYEAGSSQPTLDVIRKLAIALSVSADLLLFGKDERGTDDDLRLQFEAVASTLMRSKCRCRCWKAWS